MKICHLSSGHSQYSVRIFYKECASLAFAGHDVHFVALRSESVRNCDNGVNVTVIPKPYSRWRRFVITAYTVYRTALSLNARCYHFHDPELIPYALLLKMRGKIVFYDVHEDLPRQILSKEWIPLFARKIIGYLVEKIENISSRRFDSIICATDGIFERFKSVHDNVEAVRNYPKLQEMVAVTEGVKKIDNSVCYIGGISSIRGIGEMVCSVQNSGAVLHLAGPFESMGLRAHIETLPSWKSVKYYGCVDRLVVKEILNKTSAGIAIFHPEPNHVKAMPNKLFEYMSASIPVIASNFPLWREIVEGNKCGICVDPTNTDEIADAIKFIIENPEKAREMGMRGRAAVEKLYNWENESEKLLDLYRRFE